MRNSGKHCFRQMTLNSIYAFIFSRKKIKFYVSQLGFLFCYTFSNSTGFKDHYSFICIFFTSLLQIFFKITAINNIYNI